MVVGKVNVGVLSVRGVCACARVCVCVCVCVCVRACVYMCRHVHNIYMCVDVMPVVSVVRVCGNGGEEG